MALVQRSQRLQQPFAHVGEHGRRRLASADDLGIGQIDGNDFSEGAAEIDKECEGAQGKTERSKREVRLSKQIP